MDNQSIEDQRRARGYLVFLGWLVAAIGAYGVIILQASGRAPVNCQSTGFGSCWSDRDGVIFLGWLIGAPCAGAEFVAGLVATALYNKCGWHPFATGSAAFFSTAPFATGLVLIVMFQ
jgi:hypothetical protein